MWPYLLAQAEIVVHYVRLAIVPSPLVFLYDWPLGTSLAAVAWQFVLLAALVALTAVGIAKRHPASLLGAWFFLILAPSSSVLPIVTEVAAEHRMYLPLAAIVAAAVVGVVMLGRRFVPSAKVRGAAAAILVAAVVFVFGAETRARNRVYWSAETLWLDTVTKRPNDARARVAYGDVLAAAGRLAEAEAQLEKGLALSPNDPVARVRMGVALARQQKLDAAVPHLERALALRPGDVDAHRFLGEIYALRRQDALAANHYEQALAALPGDPQLLGRLALLLAESRDPAVKNASRAAELASQAVRLTGGRDPRVIEALSASQAATGAFAQAAATARAGASAARARGEGALASALERRAAAYDQAARQPFGPLR
jgi:tetratricopeptide (TPR) repeat protein